MQPPGGHAAEATSGQLLLVALVIGAMAAALTWVVTAGGRQDRGSFSDSWVGSIVGSDEGPPTVHVAHPHRLLPAPHAAPDPGGFSLLTADNGTPVRWDPCQPIRYVVSGTEPFLGATALLRDAFAKASAATGLKFVYAGVTAEEASDDRSPYQPLLYGDRWAPVLVAWTDGQHAPPLGSGAIGLGGPRMAMVDGTPRLVSGIVYFDSPGLRQLVSWPDAASLTENAMLHEIGHLVGLGHVEDPAQIMYPQDKDGEQYGAGDLAGLALLGSGPCYDVR